MNASPPFKTRFFRIFKQPMVIGSLTFLAGAFWVDTFLKNNNSLKSHNACFRGIIYELNRQPKLEELLGISIKYDDSKHPFVKGHVDILKGQADLDFTVEGSLDKAQVKFIGSRYKDTDCWISKEFKVQVQDKVIDLH